MKVSSIAVQYQSAVESTAVKVSSIAVQYQSAVESTAVKVSSIAVQYQSAVCSVQQMYRCRWTHFSQGSDTDHRSSE